MKKLLALLIVLVLSISALASCDVAGLLEEGMNTAFGTEDKEDGKTDDSGKTEDPKSDLESAKKYVSALYKEMTVTGADYELVATVVVDGITYTVNWKVDVTADVKVTLDSAKGVWVVDVNEEAAKDVPYTLTATISDKDGNKVERAFKLTLPKFKVNSHAEYMAAKENDNLVIEGIIAGMNSKDAGNKRNHLFLVDASGVGGYYIYDMPADPVKDLNLKVGMTVRVNGKAAPYEGMMEIKEGVVTAVIDATEKTVTAYDLTAECLKDEPSFAQYVGMLVTIKGVTLGNQAMENANHQYLNFTLGKVSSYLRTYVTDFPVGVVEADKATIDAFHASKYGYTADVTGIIVMYGQTAYLMPITNEPFTNVSLPALEPADQIKSELGALDIPEHVEKAIDFTLPKEGKNYPGVKFAWTVSENACVVYDAETGKVTITLPDEATTVTITLTATCEGADAVTKEFEIKVDAAAADLYIPKAETAPTAGKAYKLSLYQAQLGKYLYFAGTTESESVTYRLATTDNVANAVDVYLETVADVEGAYRLYFMAGETKTYIEVYERSAGSGSLRLVTETPENYYTVDSTLGILVHTVGENSYYLGTYNKNANLSASNTSYITGNNASKVGVSQFPASLSTLAPAQYAPKAETPVADKAFKLSLYQAQLGKYLYFAGTTESESVTYRLATTDNLANAVDVYLETVADVEGAYRLYFMAGETKTYIEVYERSAGSGSLRLVTETPENYYTVDSTLGILVHTVGENSYYLGTYNKNANLSASNTSYITGDNASKVGVSQFPASLTTLELKEIAPVAATPATDKAFKLSLYQAQLGKFLYFAGTTESESVTYRLATTDKLSKAVDVYLEAVEGVEGAYRLYFMAGETKTYIEVYERSAGSGSLRLVTETPENYYTVDSTLGILVHTVGENSYYLGTYNKNANFSASNTSYITGDNASKVGVSQFPANISTIEFVKGVITDDEKVAAEKKDLDIVTSFSANGTLTLPTAGETYDDVVITWTKNGEAHTGDVEITQTNAVQTIALVATITCGDASVTKEFTVTVAALPVAGTTEVVFELGENGTATHVDGSEIKGTKEYTQDGYTLAIVAPDGNKVYSGAYDATGKSCLKLGTSSVVGTFTFTVGDNVDKVIINVAGYKAKTSKVTVNGGEAVTLTTSSDNGEYQAIEIDTSTNKTVTFATVSGACRAMIDSIVLVIEN